MSNRPANTGGNALETLTPVKASPAKMVAEMLGDPEFLDAAALNARFGIKRSLAYALLAEGSIKGVSLRRRGQLRGKRLFVVDSVREFLRAQMEDQKQ